MIARYIDSHGRTRELVAWPGAGGSVLVVDRDAATLGDRRLVGHLFAEEPAGNVERLCRLYLADRSRGRCRALSEEDLRAALPGEQDLLAALACSDRSDASLGAAADADAEPAGHGPLRCEGRLYRLRASPDARGRVRQLRWCVASPSGGPWTPLGLRDVIASFERYEPMRTLTARALAHERAAGRLATGTLHGELCRLQSSAMVLNRGLREAVLRAVDERNLSLSEIALRCGKVKRDANGRLSGQTSWLTRRIGLAPEAGTQRTVRWVHSDVLALIARHGLGLSPREVELE